MQGSGLAGGAAINSIAVRCLARTAACRTSDVIPLASSTDTPTTIAQRRHILKPAVTRLETQRPRELNRSRVLKASTSASLTTGRAVSFCQFPAGCRAGEGGSGMRDSMGANPG